ncbi:hypothetical protein GGR51DRAFT_508155 [Nemania sp. FL0031]|nr:hypothetical protein GGR51DRAFT_508155 [Nemania sp. FL0031]
MVWVCPVLSRCLVMLRSPILLCLLLAWCAGANDDGQPYTILRLVQGEHRDDIRAVVRGMVYTRVCTPICSVDGKHNIFCPIWELYRLVYSLDISVLILADGCRYISLHLVGQWGVPIELHKKRWIGT